jgi:hypothetical protein
MSSFRHREALLVRAALSTLALLVDAEAMGADEPGLPGMTYASMQALPRFEGWWNLGEPGIAEYLRIPPPMRAEDWARMRAVATQDLDPDPARWCKPAQFAGFSGGFVDSIEFLFTPGRITLTTEGGLVRRIYTDGRSLPQDIEDSHTGTSVGHWEGTTLVVETAGIDPKNKFAPLAGAPAIGKNVRVTERISLKDENTLEFDITVVAPDLFTRPDRRKRIYTRTPKQAAREISFCVDYDRSIDPSTGQQRFDLTPPADLPPPPPR